MNRKITNMVFSLLLTAFAGIGLTASAQDPSCCPQPVACAQPVCAQPACPQPTTCAVACGDPCVDMCDLVKRIEKNADRLRKHFKESEKCLDCGLDDSYYESVKAFEKATDRLKKDYRENCGDQCNDSGAQAAEVLSLANCISAYMDPCALCPEAVADWNALRADLETLANQYCTTASFQQPVSLQPACVQTTCCPVQTVQPVQTCCPNN